MQTLPDYYWCSKSHGQGWHQTVSSMWPKFKCSFRIYNMAENIY